MCKPYLKLIALLMLTCLYQAKAQIPVNDPAWQIQTGASEEFNAPLDFTTKWYNQYPWGPLNNGAEYNKPANLDQSTGTTLKIVADTLVPGIHVAPSRYADVWANGVTYVYQSGAIQTRQVSGSDVYKFGYLEVYAKYPTSYYPLWPASWVWGCDGGPYNEIDYAENGAANSYDGHKMGTNKWINTSTCNNASGSGQDITGLPLLSSAFHKYATEWAPDRVNYYFDDVLVRSVSDPSGATIPQNPMAAIINFAIDPWYAYLPSDWNNDTIYHSATNPVHGNASPTLWPQYLEIDYMRYYKLNTDCNTNLTICTPSTDYSSRAVEKTIEAGGSCTPTFNTSDEYTLRATDNVTLDAGTTIADNGSGYFAIIIMPCPQ